MISNQLRTFLAAAQCNGFSAAARQLGVTQPYVSRQIKQLEDICQGRLFERKGRSIHLTGLGHELMAISKRMVDAELDAYQLLASARQMRAGYLHIAAVGPYHLMDMLGEFHRRYPKVNVKVTFGDSKTVENAVVNMDADIGVLSADRHIAHCIQRTYRRCPLVLQVHASHRFAGRASVSLRELQDEPVIFREEGSATRRLFDTMLYECGIQVHSVMQLGSREAIRLAVAKGLGVAYVSQDECDPHPEVSFVAIDENPVLTNATVLWRAGRETSGPTAVFLKTLRMLPAAPGESAQSALP